MSLQAPDLADPLGGLDFEDLDPNGRASKVEVGPDLSTPYSHQYNFSWEFEVASNWRLQLGYVGSRSHKLIITYFLNRGQYVEGIPFTSKTINERRADQSLFEYLFTHNGSRGFYDAGRVSLIAPQWHGLSLNISYWFSKAIDLGGDYTNTASGPDARIAVGQTEFESQKDLRGLSSFDQPHAFLVQASYETPRVSDAGGWLQRVFGSWNLSGVGLLKTGTPFTVESGSDGPGFGNVDSMRGDRVMLLDPSVLGRTIGDPDTASQLLPRSAFRFIQRARGDGRQSSAAIPSAREKSPTSTPCCGRAGRSATIRESPCAPSRSTCSTRRSSPSRAGSSPTRISGRSTTP